jgi:membrane protease YdiL (CAAX protease family)
MPVLVRAIIGGCFVFVVLSSGYNVIVVPNMTLSPSIPWSVPLGLLYLWVAFKYFNGKWKPASTSKARSESMRARRLMGGERKAALAASVPVLVFFVAVTFISYRLIDIPADDTVFPDMPWWSLYSALVMISIVAGVSEEAGFRGYMQGPLEKRYGPVVAIGIGAVFFWLAHLNHASGVARFPALVVMGASLGALTYCARSVLPAIITHATADIIVFTGSTADIGLHDLWHPVPLKDSGVDALFVVMSALVVVSGVAMAITLKRLANATRTSDEPRARNYPKDAASVRV